MPLYPNHDVDLSWLMPFGKVSDEALSANDGESDGERGAAVTREADELEDGSLDPDELRDEPDWWDEGSDDET